MHIAVLICGDIGRAPRMTNHILALTQDPKNQITYIGQLENNAPSFLTHNSSTIKLINIPYKWLTIIRRLPTIFYFILRFMIQTFLIFYIFMFRVNKPDVILVQNPPSQPVLSTLWMIKLILRPKIIVDIHNYGYTLLYSTNSKLQKRFCEKYEKFFIRRITDYHLCVSRAMKYDVYHNWGLKTKPIVVYDKPNLEFFKEFDVKQKNEFFNQYQEFWDRQDLKYEFSAVDDEKILNKADYDDQQQSSEKFELLDGIGKGVQLYTINRHELQLDDNVSEFSVESEKFKKKSGNYQVIQTENNRGEDIVEKKERPFLIVTSTSYTDDEDLGILFKAIERLEEISERFLKKRRIHVVITGKGPNKEKFRCYIAAKRQFWKRLRVDQIWLMVEDYPKMLASADLGVCQHYSSSGVDLPMKVIDMYGAVLPVIAIDYKSIRESVEENVTGRIFTDENDLFKILKEIIVDFNGKNEILKRYKSNIRLKRESNTWMDQWNKKVLPIFQRISNGYPLTRKNSSGKKETRKKSKQEKITDLQKKLEENVEKAQHNLLYNELRSDDSQLQYMGLIGEPQTSILQDEDKQNLNKRHP